jgi:hypothetical protein
MPGFRTAMVISGILAFSALSVARAAPPGVAPIVGVIESNVTQIHRQHPSCQRDGRGWHRHNSWGERRSCRRWDGRGRRPSGCVRVGGIWLCG